MLNVKNKKITVLGLARSGVASANLLYGLGAKVRISDVKPKEKLNDFINQLVSRDIEVSTSSDQIKDIHDADMVILSPGIPSDIPAMVEAKKENIPVIGEVELAYQVCKCESLPLPGQMEKQRPPVWLEIFSSQHGTGR